MNHVGWHLWKLNNLSFTHLLCFAKKQKDKHLNSIIFNPVIFPTPNLACKKHLAKRFILYLFENIWRLVISNQSWKKWRVQPYAKRPVFLH